jgi:hypothetical protein
MPSVINQDGSLMHPCFIPADRELSVDINTNLVMDAQQNQDAAAITQNTPISSEGLE